MIVSLLLTIFTFVELNCENLFDCKDDSLKQDEQFLPDGLYHWTPPRYWKKLNRIGQELLACGEQADGTCTVPDLVALCEVENDSVMFDLTRRSLLRNAQYEYVLTASPDVRGIDVALLYSPLTFAVDATYPIRVEPMKDMRPTRDILYAKLRTAQDDTLHVFVVHAPSRWGGEIETRPHRKLVTRRLAESVDSILAISPEANIIAAGDFNDYHTSSSMKALYESGLTDISKDARGENGALATYKYRGEWGSLDHILVTCPLLPFAECRVFDAPFLLCEDEKYGGVQPFRNYYGIKYQGGFSDHLPLVARLRIGQ